MEVAPGIPDVVPVRDSKNAEGHVLLFSLGEWASFINAVKDGAFSVTR
ncbi:DUF397 domain-containing protein [Streptomyces sp. NRRL S-337]|nr:DUF397 domain-containing protein [Streptomyces sp. NRRL S-337]